MEDWGKYLKNAVANVEQQIDKVLLENQNADPVKSPTQAQPAPRSSSDIGRRTDLSERLRQAAHGRSSQDSARSSNSVNTGANVLDGKPPPEPIDTSLVASSNDDQNKGLEDNTTSLCVNNDNSSLSDANEEPNLITVSTLVIAPEFAPHLDKARRLALKTRTNDALDLVEGLETYHKEIHDFEENVSCRLVSANSKLAVLSRAKIKTSSGLENQIAMLVEEGTRLSKRELDLGTNVKKLRADRQAALKKCEQVSQKEAEIQSLKTVLENTKQNLRDTEAEVEHLRSYKETSTELSTHERRESSDLNSLPDGNVQLDASTKSFIEERERWHKMESELLSRIAELEQNHELRTAVSTQIQQRLLDAQKAAGLARDEQAALQDEFDAMKHTFLENEEKLKARLKNAEEKISKLEERNGSHEEDPLQASSSKLQTKTPGEGAESIESVGSDLSQIALSSSPHPLDESSFRYSPPPSVHIEKEFEAESDFNTFDQNQVALGPSGPFGTLAEDFDPYHQPSGERYSQGLIDDGSSFLNASRRESSMLGSESISGSQLHLIRKLTASVRRLESELSTAQKAAELSKQQRLDAQAEIARLIEVQEELESVRTVNESLSREINSLKEQLNAQSTIKTEYHDRIEELDADIQDLKDMYKEQIEALIGEIESLKRA